MTTRSTPQALLWDASLAVLVALFGNGGEKILREFENRHPLVFQEAVKDPSRFVHALRLSFGKASWVMQKLITRELRRNAGLSPSEETGFVETLSQFIKKPSP